jgi:Ca2+-binding EF-hand superfamily protein
MNLNRTNTVAGVAWVLFAFLGATPAAAGPGIGNSLSLGGTLDPRTYQIDAGAGKEPTAKEPAAVEPSLARKLLDSLEKPEKPETMRRFDKNSDGLLDDAERIQMFEELGNEPYKGPGPSKQELLSKYDKNGDGKLDDAEQAELKNRVIAEQMLWKDLIKKYDLDGDGRLSETERTTARTNLEKEVMPEEGIAARFFKNPKEFREEIARNKIFSWLYAGLELDSEAGYEGSRDGEGAFWDASLSGGAEFNYLDLVVARLVLTVDRHLDYGIDEMLARLGGSKKIPLFIAAGHASIPFGEYNSHFKTDPMIQVLGEVEAWYVSAGYDSDAGGANLTVFRGHDNAGDYDLVAHGEIEVIKGMDVGAAWTSDLSESKELRSLKHDLKIEGIERTFPTGSSVMGLSAFFQWETNRFDLDAEFVMAVKSFRAGVLAESPRKPWAFDIEGAIRPVDQWEISARFEMSRGIPKGPPWRVGIGMSYGICKYATVSIEFLIGPTDRARTVVGLDLRF